MARIASFFVLVGLIFAPAVTQSADQDGKSPSVIVRLRSIDGLLSDVLYLAKSAGKEEEARQLDGFLQAFITEKEGLKGIDTKRSLGFYSILSADVISSSNVVLVPIANEKAFLEFLDVLNQKAKKDKDGIYTVSPDGVPVSIHFRFANQYLYVTAPEKDALAKTKLLDPTQVFSASETSLFSLAWNLDRVPEELRKIAASAVDNKLSEEQDKKVPNETDAQKAVRVQSLKEIAKQIGTVIDEGRQLAFKINVDQKARALSGELSLSGKAKSKLAKQIGELGDSKSVFADLKASDAAARFLLHVSLSADLRKALEPAIDEGIQAVLEKEKDEGRKAVAEKLLNAIKPSLKAGELDAGFTLIGPNKDQRYTFVGGIKLQKTKDIDAAFREVVKLAPERERDLIKFDAEKAGAVGIHRLDGQKAYPPEVRQVLGEQPFYLAFRGDSAWLAGGAEGLATLKEMLASRPAAAPQFQLDVAFARLAPTLGIRGEERGKQINKAAKDVFTRAGDDQLSVVVAGGAQLQLRFSIKTAVVQFLARVGEIDKQKAKDQE